MDRSWPYILAAGASLCVIAWLYARRPYLGLHLPPGPKLLPLIGSALDMPLESQWLTFHKWRKQYGDIVYTEVLGTKFVILGSAERTSDFFVERSAIYSDRMLLPMHELMGLGEWTIINQGYGPWWRAHRRMFTAHFRSSVISKYHPVQTRKIRDLQRRILDMPEDFFYHIHHTVSSIILAITYGIEAKESDDPYIQTAQEMANALAKVAPGAFLVDFLPALKYVPRWFPGAGFQGQAAHWKRVGTTLVDRPWKFVKDGLLHGTATPCIATEILEKLKERDNRAEEELIAKHCAGVVHIAGADTTASSALSFILAMTMYPDVQKKAQAELDAVIGYGKSPVFDDLSSLPYTNAVMIETFRWQPATPIGVPHCSVRDDEYDGFFIPKGSIVVGNAWSILHDPDMYPDPEEFKPDRFLKGGKLDPNVSDSVAAFGFGRRKCPGQSMATQSLFSIVTAVLSAFDITPLMNESGKPIKLRPEMSTGLLSTPLPFKNIIKPRSEAIGDMIREFFETDEA